MSPSSIMPESFQYLAENVPHWLSNLSLLSQQVTERQGEFNHLSQSNNLSVPSVRKRKTGSTESLRPADLDESPTEPAGSDYANANPNAHSTPTPPTTTSHPLPTVMPPPPTPGTPNTPSTPLADLNLKSKRLFQDRREAARRKRKSTSILSGASGPQKHRSRMSLIVYYDSTIQTGFENLVRGIASARNTLRKGKMAASYNARLASSMMQQEERANLRNVEKTLEAGSRGSANGAAGDDDTNGGRLRIRNQTSIPSFNRTPSPFSASASASAAAGTLALEQYDVLEADLEAAQTLCEVGAHQFLRDANCTEELVATREKFENCLKIAREQVELLTLQPAENWEEVDERTDGGRGGRERKVIGDAGTFETKADSGNAMMFEVDKAYGRYDLRKVSPEVDRKRYSGADVKRLSGRGAGGFQGIAIDDDAMAGNTNMNGGAAGGENKMMIEIDDSSEVALPRNVGFGPGMIKIDDSPDPSPVASKSPGFGLGAIEIDDSNEDKEEYKIDLAAFRRTRRTRD